MVKKIVILAAGGGTRMLGAAGDNPKHLIGIEDRPFLYYSCQNCLDAGFEEIILVVGHKKERMEDFARNYKDKFPITLVDQFEEVGTDKYGTACPVEAAKKNVGDENFVVANGDDFYSAGDLRRMREINDDYCYVAGFAHEDPSPYGLHKMGDDGLLEGILEKPTPDVDYDSSRPLDYLINIGLYRFTPRVFEAIKRIKKSPRGEYEITDAITDLAGQKKMKVSPIEDYWHTLSRPEDIEKMQKVIRDLKRD